MKNLHLINNEKITLDMIRLFNGIDSMNTYVIFDRKIKYSNDYSPFQNILFARDVDSTHLEKHYDNVLIHSLDIKKVDFFLKYIHNETNVIWLLWGGEVYNRPEWNVNLYGRETLFALIKSSPLKEISKIMLGNIRGRFGEMGRIKKFSKRIDVVATTLPFDYMLAKKLFKINPSFMEFNFYRLDEKNVVSRLPSRNSIEPLSVILGNSGDPSNNHLEMIDLLNNLDAKISVVCPLSYGPSSYIRKVIRKGNSILKDNFQALTSFLNYGEYMELLHSVQIAIYGFRRQQGIGNIVHLIHLGKTIYLDPSNPMYDFLRDNGIVVRSLKSIGKEDSFLLNEEEVEGNKVQIYNLFGPERYALLANRLFL